MNNIKQVLILLLMPFMGFVYANRVIMRDYNKVDVYHFDSLEHLTENLFSNNGKATINILLAVADDNCADKLQAPAFLGIQRYGAKVMIPVTIPYDQSPVTPTACAEIFWYPLGSTIMNPRDRVTDFDHSFLNAWTNSINSVSVLIANEFPYIIDLFYEDESTDPKYQGAIEPNRAIRMTTHLGHVFSMRKAQSDHKGEVVDYMVVNGDDYYANPSNHLETCDITPDNSFHEILDVEISCDNMEGRKDAFANEIWHQKRIALNFVQPQLVPPVTNEGFKLLRLPKNTYKWLLEWYNKQKEILGIEEGLVGPCMNQASAPSEITHLTPVEKDRLSNDLKQILLDWYGKGDLTLTSIYGIRKYVNGSILRMHVDTVNTHVVSAIINVDQDVDEPWYLVILDHDYNEHKVEMKAGDMLLYESAKLLHGRPEPMIGRRYENVFIHYMPVVGWDYSWV